MKLDQINKITSRIPSLQDLISAAATFQIGKPSVIYPEEGGHIIIQPMRGRKPQINPNKYNELVKTAVENNNMEILVNGLKQMGFDLSGEGDGRIGHMTNPKLQSQVKQFGSKVPTSTGKEEGGISVRDDRGIRATELKRTGTKDHVELEVPYAKGNINTNKIDPQTALDDTDDFVFHTHPKITDNNYFPGSTQRK